MSTTITSMYGEKLHLAESMTTGYIAFTSEVALNGRNFEVTDLLNAIKAEGGLDTVEIIIDLPKIGPSGSTGYVSAGSRSYSVTEDWADGRKHRAVAMERLAIARYLEAKNSEAARAEETALRKHRQRIVNSHSNGLGAYDYDSLDTNGKYIVDTIRELEDQLAAK